MKNNVEKAKKVYVTLRQPPFPPHLCQVLFELPIITVIDLEKNLEHPIL
jgi:hypothetical protein